jgi:hypothetical protein
MAKVYPRIVAQPTDWPPTLPAMSMFKLLDRHGLGVVHQ